MIPRRVTFGCADLGYALEGSGWGFTKSGMFAKLILPESVIVALVEQLPEGLPSNTHLLSIEATTFFNAQFTSCKPVGFTIGTKERVFEVTFEDAK